MWQVNVSVANELNDQVSTTKIKTINHNPQLSAMDVSDLVTMKDAASCETQCDLQTSENH